MLRSWSDGGVACRAADPEISRASAVLEGHRRPTVASRRGVQMCVMDILFSEGSTYRTSADERAIRLRIIPDEFVF